MTRKRPSEAQTMLCDRSYLHNVLRMEGVVKDFVHPTALQAKAGLSSQAQKTPRCNDPGVRVVSSTAVLHTALAGSLLTGSGTGAVRLDPDQAGNVAVNLDFTAADTDR